MAAGDLAGPSQGLTIIIITTIVVIIIIIIIIVIITIATALGS